MADCIVELLDYRADYTVGCTVTDTADCYKADYTVKPADYRVGSMVGSMVGSIVAQPDYTVADTEDCRMD